MRTTLVALAIAFAGCGDDSSPPLDAALPDSEPAADGAPPPPDAAPWVNPGCDAAENVVAAGFSFRAEIDLSRYAERTYDVRQSFTVRPDAPGDAVTMFGFAFELGAASHGYRYDGQRATFCTGPFAAGDEVTIEVAYNISEARMMLPAGSLAGVHVWGETTGTFAIGPYTTPFFSSLWLLAPQTVTWFDTRHDGNVAAERFELSVIAPEGFTVLGPGAPSVSGSTWSFAVERPMPLYAISFAASPGYEAFELPSTATGVGLAGAVTPVRRRDAEQHIAVAGEAVDWMSEHIGAFPWDERLGFAEIPGYPGGFEHTAAVWLGSSVLDGTIGGDYVAIHEAVHHWFGNDVRIADWEHLWLAEGLTDWVTVFAIMEEVSDPAAARARQRRMRTEAAAMSLARPGAPPPGPLRFADAGEIVGQIGNNLLFFYSYGASFLEMVDQRLRRSHDTDLVALLSRWHARHTGAAVTTEMFRDFLIEETGDASFTELFEQWVYATPAPTLEVSDYALGGGTASFRLHRDAAAGQELPAIEVVFVSGGTRIPVTVSLGATESDVTVSAPMATPPGSIEIDPTGFYILGLRTGTGWTGPPVTNGS